MATIKGIKLLHKRYTYDQWVNGTGLAVKPSLSFGEFGIATDTKEVRCNTHTAGEIAFTAATLVSFPNFESKTGQNTAQYISNVLFDNDPQAGAKMTVVKGTLPSLELEHDGTSSGSFITGLEVDPNNSHKLIYTLGNAPASTISITGTAASTEPTSDTLDVVTEITDGGSSGHNHKIAYKTNKVATKKYVDDKVAGAGITLVESGKTATSNIVTSINAENKDGVHTITATYGEIIIPKSSGGKTAGDTEFISKAVMDENHNLTAESKALVGSKTTTGNGEITVTNVNGNVQVQLDDSNYALKSELSMAMVFKGTLGTGGTITTLPAATDNTVGDAYKVITAGNYGAGELADCDAGDMLVCRHVSGSQYEWTRIPAGDDIDDFVKQVTAGTGIEVTTGFSPVVSHKDYSSAASVAADMTTTSYGHTGKVITGISVDSDGLGHITATPSSTTVDIVSEEGARAIAREEESITTVSGNGKITVTDSADAGSNDHAYVITHAGVTKNDNDAKTANATHGGTIKAVTGVTYDDTGHVSGVEATTFTLPADNNSWRPVYVDGTSFLSGSTSTAQLDISAGQNITLDKNTTNGKVTIKTLGTATASAQGFVKLGTDTVVAGSQVYAVGVDSTGKLAVQVPWTDTDQYKRETGTAGHFIITPEAGAEGGVTDANYGTREMRFCAIGRDHGGHVVAAEDIQVLDGNA